MRLRVWPAAVVVVLAGLWLAYVWFLSEGDRQSRILGTYGTIAVAEVALAVWLAAFSRVPRRKAFGILGGVALGVLAFAALFRFRGLTGDFVPVFEPRWSRARPAPVEPVGAAAPPAPVAATPLPESTAAPAASAAPADAPEAASAPAATGDWPGFQGRLREATVASLRLSRDWAARPPRPVWRRPVGEAWSGFAVAGGVAVTQEQHGADERVAAYELATGRPLWTDATAARYETVIAGVGPRATPSLHGGRVYAQGATGVLVALDLASGRRLWSRDVVGENGAVLAEWGKSGSPLVVDGRVIVNAGGAGRSLVAYDAATGAPAWAAGSGRASYSSPVLLTLAGRPQVVVLNSASVAGHDPQTGAVLWEAPFPGGQPNVATPLLLAPDRLLVSVGYGVGSKAYRVAAGPAGALEPALLWESPRLKSKFANLVRHGGFVYGLDDGVLTCLDPETGERRWKEGRYGHGQLLLAGGLLLVQTEEGELALIDPNPDAARELARVPLLAGKIWNPPALAGRLLLVRNEREAAAFELPVE